MEKKKAISLIAPIREVLLRISGNKNKTFEPLDGTILSYEKKEDGLLFEVRHLKQPKPKIVIKNKRLFKPTTRYFFIAHENMDEEMAQDFLNREVKISEESMNTV
jgi:hypothetical protein